MVGSKQRLFPRPQARRPVRQFGQRLVPHLDVVGHGPALGCERETAIPFVVHEPAPRQPAHHVRNRRSAQPAIVGDIYLDAGESNWIFVADGYAYVSGHGAEVSILGVSTPTNPKLAGKYASGTSSTGLYVCTH
jgi:hypothetical protein